MRFKSRYVYPGKGVGYSSGGSKMKKYRKRRRFKWPKFGLPSRLKNRK